MADYLDRLAAFIYDTRYEDLSEPAVVSTKKVLLDTLGCILAGSQLPENRSLATLISQTFGNGNCTFLGQGMKGSAQSAAWVNGTAGSSLELDGGSLLGGAHPASHVVPPAVAVAEENGLGGKPLIEAILIGYEVTSRLGGATRLLPDIHPGASWGTIGAAVTVAKLLGYQAHQIRQVINVASALTPANSWTLPTVGANVRNALLGRSGVNGIMAVILHKAGFEGLKDGPADTYGMIIGESFDPEVVVQGLDQDNSYRIQSNYYKLHACCYFNHPTLDSVMAMLNKERFGPEDVERIQVTSTPAAQRIVGGYPETMLGTKFSIGYAVAASIVRGTTDMTSFTREALQDDEMRHLFTKVHLSDDARMDLAGKDYPSARVVVSLKDGRKLSHETGPIHGGADDPASDEELLDKFMALSRDPLGETRASQVIEAVNHLDELDDVTRLTSLLEGQQ